jgi:pimeloyl-ACP methyl ester carboxylesterase
VIALPSRGRATATIAALLLAATAGAESLPMPSQEGAGGLAMLDWRPLAAAIEAPTLILWGDQDLLFDARSQERLPGAVPGARLETFAGLGHNLLREDSERVAAAIGDFRSE